MKCLEPPLEQESDLQESDLQESDLGAVPLGLETVPPDGRALRWPWWKRKDAGTS